MLEEVKKDIYQFFNHHYDARYIYLARFIERYYYAVSNAGRDGILRKSKLDRLVRDENLEAAFLIDSFGVVA